MHYLMWHSQILSGKAKQHRDRNNSEKNRIFLLCDSYHPFQMIMLSISSGGRFRPFVKAGIIVVPAA